jgi:YrbI family 3-deoxy-D-manno-octulosonate 8-phosphate phosphatase
MRGVCNILNQPIRLFLYDFDGVLTDNSVLVNEDGIEAVFCNRSDGLAISRIKGMGIAQAIISTEMNKVVSVRAAKLGIPVIQGIDNKKKAVLVYCEKLKIGEEETLYIGNDLNDLEAMLIVGFPVCPNDAYPEIKRISKLVLPVPGGKGVVRELINHVDNIKEK